VHRLRFGLGAGDVAVLVTSTFGPHGMIGRHGWAYLDAALGLPPKFRTILCLHPHLWTGRHDNRMRLTELLAPRVGQGLIMCGPDDDFAPYLAAADVAVIDHGSLGLYWALLARPTVAVPVPAHALNLTAPIAALRASAPLAVEPGRLGAGIDRALSVFDPEVFAPHRRSLVARPGHAADALRAVFYELVGLDAPPKAA
jgi:hypothetical protein